MNKKLSFSVILLLMAIFSQAADFATVNLAKKSGGGDIGPKIYNLAYDNDSLFAATDDGIWVSSSFQRGDWVLFGLEGETVTHLNFDVERLAIVATTGNVKPLYKWAGGVTWTPCEGLDGVSVVVSGGFAQAMDGNKHVIMLPNNYASNPTNGYVAKRSEDGGTTFSDVNTRAPVTNKASARVYNIYSYGSTFFSSIQADGISNANSTNAIFTGSSDYGATWPANVWASSGMMGNLGYCVTLPSPPFDPNTGLGAPMNGLYVREIAGDTVLYIGGMNGLFINNQGVTKNILESMGANILSITSQGENDLYILSRRDGLYKSTDNGENTELLTTTSTSNYNQVVLGTYDVFVASDQGIEKIQLGDYPWDGVYTEPIAKGSGTATDPWQIENVAQWAWATKSANGMYAAGVHLRLMADLDLTNPTGANSPVFNETGSTGFKGFFDGNNKKLYNVTVVSDADRVAVFHSPSYGSVICNLGVESGTFDGGTKGRTGAIAGYGQGDVLNCYNKATVKGGADCVAGIVGNAQTGSDANLARISNCFNFGAISSTRTGSQARVAGIVGRGEAGHRLINCYNVGAITSPGTSEVSAIVGAGPYPGTANNYYNSETSIATGGGTAMTTTEMKTQDLADKLNAGEAQGLSKIWIIDETGVINDGYPYLNEAYRVFLPTVAGAVVAPVAGYDTIFAYKDDVYKFTIIPTDPTKSPQGLTVECNGVTLTPDENDVYTIDGTIDDYQIVTATGTLSARTFNVTDDNQTPTFGTVTMTQGSSPVDYDGSVTYTIAPNTGYYVSSLLINGQESKDLIVNDELVLDNITEHKKIEVTFAIRTFAITATASPAGGSIVEAEGSVNPVPYDGSITFIVTVDEGYEITSFKVDDIDETLPDDGKYTFSNVTDPHTIDVTFALKQYTITASAGEGGAIDPDGEVSVSHGANQPFTVTPDEGYEVASVLVDGVAASLTGNTYTFTNVTKAYTIEVTFVLKQYAITASAGTGGTIDPSGEVSVTHGLNQTFTVIPDTNYEVATVLVDGAAATLTDGKYTFENVMGAHTIAITFTSTVGLKNAFANGWAIASADGLIQITSADVASFDVQLYNVTGKLLSITASEGNTAYVNAAPGSIYIVKIICEDEAFTVKVTN